MSLSANSMYIHESNNWVDEADLLEVRASPLPSMSVVFGKIGEGLKRNRFRVLTRPTLHPTLGEQMVQRATGTSFSHQRIKSDDALSVEVPDIRAISDQTRTECDELVEMVGKRRSENEHLSRLRDVLLPELLSGRLRVKDAESMMENV